jgi:hypothetical protein
MGTPLEVTYNAVDRFTKFARRHFPAVSVFTYGAVDVLGSVNSGIGKN